MLELLFRIFKNNYLNYKHQIVTYNKIFPKVKIIKNYLIYSIEQNILFFIFS